MEAGSMARLYYFRPSVPKWKWTYFLPSWVVHVIGVVFGIHSKAKGGGVGEGGGGGKKGKGGDSDGGGGKKGGGLPGTEPGGPWDPKRKLTKKEIHDGCDAGAVQIQKAIGGDIVKIIPDMPGTPENKRIFGTMTVMGETLEWGHHTVVMKGDMVYDLVLTGPAGMKKEEFVKLFPYPDALIFQKQ